uniref:Ig-like domain-containing protein n=1 Tax=Pundamilia nyererei TaxID=303518 RepID=A0A3B4F3E3_9CICH
MRITNQMCFSLLADTFVTAICGQDVVLPCQDTTASPVMLVQWRKSTISSCYLYLFRNLRSYDNYQCDMFKGRVKPLEPSVGNANWSVILRNVSVADTGLYMCEITARNTKTGQNHVVSEGRVNVTVAHSPQPRGRPGIIAALILLLTVIVVLCGVVWIRANQKHKTPEDISIQATRCSFNTMFFFYLQQKEIQYLSFPAVPVPPSPGKSRD